MSDFLRPSVQHKARKPHRCTYCGESIDVDSVYHRQTGVWDGSWFVSKFHPECFEELCEDPYGGEFTPYSQERPTA